MNAVLTDLNSTASARVLPLDSDQLAHRVPAAIADRPAAKTTTLLTQSRALVLGALQALVGWSGEPRLWARCVSSQQSYSASSWTVVHTHNEESDPLFWKFDLLPDLGNGRLAS